MKTIRAIFAACILCVIGCPALFAEKTNFTSGTPDAIEVTGRHA
jgi:hypothetical protein